MKIKALRVRRRSRIGGARAFVRILAPLAALSLGGCVTIYDAASKGFDHQVSAMIAAGTNPNVRSVEGATPLLIAVVNGRLSTVKLLLAHGADPNEPNAKGDAPLAYAVSKNLPDVAEALIAGGALVDKKSSDGTTPIMLAVKNDNPAMIAILVAHGASLSAKSSGGSPLMVALRMGRIDLLQNLLRQGVDPNEPDESGQTPIEFATYANRPDLVSALQAFGAKPIGVRGRIGLGLGVEKDGALAVNLVASDSPAANAGIAVGDRLLAVNGESAANRPLAKITESLRGGAGTFLTVTLRRGDGPPTTYTLVRQPVGLQAPSTSAASSSSPAPAATTPEIASDVDTPGERAASHGDDFALVVGIEDYESVPKAEYGLRDARAVRKHLEAMGWPARNIISLEGHAATGNKLKSYLEEWLPLNVTPESTLIVYYAGHGAPDPVKGDAYLIPWDGDPMFLKSTAYPLKQLYVDLAKLKAKRVIVALDACFSGAGGRSVLAKGARPLVVSSSEELPKADNLTVLSAAGGNEITGTLDEQGHGVFTYYLLKGLSGAAKDPRGEVTAQGLFDYLKPRVEKEARRQNRVQVPTFHGSAAGAPLATY
jgi:ankyrin repeat protein